MAAQKRVNTNPHIEDIHLKRRGNFPNSKLPVIIFREAINLPDQKNKAAVIAEKILARNGWSNSWRNGIYEFHHYHSNTHECMVVCSGKATVMIGGPGGKKTELKTGDVIILPAGTGHKCIKCPENFLCVGAYPQGKDYDLRLGRAKELQNASRKLTRYRRPLKIPYSEKPVS